MKEISFIRQNIAKWEGLEQVVASADTQDPGRLADAYTEITTDLSFSRSHYPRSRITTYLNNLASALHNALYKNKKEKRSRIFLFWKEELPLVMYESRRELLYSFLVFLCSVLIGAFSAFHDDTFVRLIMGNAYVDMTLDNIRSGRPMAVYDSHGELGMFLAITSNNIYVSFRVFIAGLLTGAGTGMMLLYNGVMVGAFQTFFFQQGVGTESLLSIWLHGALEISSIVVAGAAGFAMGNGWLFPGTYPRGYAFRQGAKKGLKIAVGLVPMFIVAGFIESFLTRHTELPDILRAAFILLSFGFVIVYFVIYPRTVWKNKHHTSSDNGIHKS
ncbi:MAG: stage II sporulation protein M [Tannerella sp.]|uniref:stage II sporulation protein M n=1 Tax=Tannerella sp. TaxID=2382127 RepID=UPI003FA1DBE5